MKRMLLFFLISTNLFAQDKALDIIKKFDVSSYRPQDKGLKEFVVQVDISNLTKQLNDQLIFGKLKNVYFKLYWVYPNQYDVEVLGLPNGFAEIKNELKGLVASRLDVIVPSMLEKKFEGYNLKHSMQTGKEQITATDSTHMKLINEIRATFDREGKLLSLVNHKPMIVEESELSLIKKSYSENKWIIDEISVKVNEGSQTTFIKTKIDYNSVEGYALPVRITSHSKQILAQGEDKTPIQREVDSLVEFKGYKINSGEASSFLKKVKEAPVIIGN